MIKFQHKQYKERACTTCVPSDLQVIKCQDEHVTTKKKLRPSVRKKTCKPHEVINSIMEIMANDVKLLNQ